MRRMIIFIILLIIFNTPQSLLRGGSLIFPAYIFAGEPLSFRNIKMGMTYDEVIDNVTYAIEDCSKNCCSARGQVKGIIIDELYCFSNKDLLDHIFVYFEPEDYEGLKEALKEKYGKSSNFIKQTIQNKMGVKFKNETTFWNFKEGDKIAISRYGTTIDKGLIVFASKEYNKAWEDIEKKKKEMPGF